LSAINQQEQQSQANKKKKGLAALAEDVVWLARSTTWMKPGADSAAQGRKHSRKSGLTGLPTAGRLRRGVA
jgi:hypothetical protein